MGSYSESCGLSGLEIAGETALVAILRQKNATEWTIVVPPLRGRHDDYGYLVIEEADRPLARAFGVDPTDREWTPLDYDIASDPLAKQPTPHQWVLPMWVHGTAFDALSSLIRDYSDAGRDGTVGDDTEAHVRRITEELAEQSSKAEDVSDETIVDGRSLRDFLREVSINRIIGYTPVLENFTERVLAAFRAGEPLDLLIEGYRRAFTLYVGALELRRPLVGQNGPVGPQHGGERAAAAFARMVLDVSEQRICDRQDDDY